MGFTVTACLPAVCGVRIPGWDKGEPKHNTRHHEPESGRVMLGCLGGSGAPKGEGKG